MASIELPLFIHKITQDCTLIFLQIIWRKQTSVIIQSFTCNHEINESNTEIQFSHCWSVWLNSKYACFYIFMPNKTFNFLGTLFNSKTVKINNFKISAIQSNRVYTNICIFIKVYYICPTLYSFRQIISRVKSIESMFILIIFLYFKVC